MQRFRRVRRLIADLIKTLVCIALYAGVTGAIALASIHVIATSAELKCAACADPATLLASVPQRKAPPEVIPDTPLRGTLTPR